MIVGPFKSTKAHGLFYKTWEKRLNSQNRNSNRIIFIAGSSIREGFEKWNIVLPRDFKKFTGSDFMKHCAWRVDRKRVKILPKTKSTS